MFHRRTGLISWSSASGGTASPSSPHFPTAEAPMRSAGGCSTPWSTRAWRTRTPPSWSGASASPWLAPASRPWTPSRSAPWPTVRSSNGGRHASLVPHLCAKKPHHHLNISVHWSWQAAGTRAQWSTEAPTGWWIPKLLGVWNSLPSPRPGGRSWWFTSPAKGSFWALSPRCWVHW